MIYIGNNETTREIDNYSVDKLHIPSIILMENAAINFVHSLNKKLDNFLIICGKGNNGGDGYAIAKQLFALNKKVSIFSCETINMSQDCQINYDICKNLGIFMENNIENLEKLLLSHNIIIDSIFGTGLDKDIKSPYDKIINLINQHSKKTISVDIPSGVNGSNGEIMGTCIKANKTISFVTYKQGFLNYDSLKYFGDIKIVNIGIPVSIIKNFSKISLLDKKYIKSLLIPRKKSSHKGDFGHTLILAGSSGFTGASVITTNASIKSGSGLVTLITHHDCQNIVASQLLEAMTANFDDKDNLMELLSKSNAIAFGPGINKSNSSLKLLKLVLENTKIPIVLDADGINLLSDNLYLLDKLKNRCIITPHLGEFSRLTKLSIKEISQDRLSIAQKFAYENSLVLLLKGYNTIITNGCEVFVNTTGNASMANGGMGDTLTGMIASFISQKYTIFDAAKIACFLHGYIGDKLNKHKSIVTAKDIIKNIPKYQKKLLK